MNELFGTRLSLRGNSLLNGVIEIDIKIQLNYVKENNNTLSC